jgi:hypothetical protein
MTDGSDNIVLEHLRHVRQQLQRLDEKVDTVNLRLGIFEGHVANFRVSEAAQNVEIDWIKQHLDRIERRLEPVD